MPSLVTIPRELRNQICTYALFAQANQRPALNQTFEQLVENRTVYDKPHLRSWNTLALRHPKDTISNATSLLLVNHQLHAETLENIKLLTKNIKYDLDVILLDEILLLPTWIRVPFLTTHLEEVNATFRISGSYNGEKEMPRKQKTEADPSPGAYVCFGRYKGFRGGDGAGPAMGWQIYSILERFIRVGSAGNRTEANEHLHVTIRTLNINVETPPDIDAARFGPPQSGSWHRSRTRNDDNGKDVLDPDYLAKFICGDILGLLRGGDHEWFSYGQILYEHVDEVVIRKDGEEMRRFDVAEMLRDVEGFQEKYLPQQKLDEYKNMVWRARRERGLKVLAD